MTGFFFPSCSSPSLFFASAPFFSFLSSAAFGTDVADSPLFSSPPWSMGAFLGRPRRFGVGMSASDVDEAFSVAGSGLAFGVSSSFADFSGTSEGASMDFSFSLGASATSFSLWVCFVAFPSSSSATGGISTRRLLPAATRVTVRPFLLPDAPTV